MVEWKKESLQLVLVRVILGTEFWVFISTYGPGSENSEEVINGFRNNLKSCIESLKVKNKVIVLSNMNARGGKEVVECVCGRYGVVSKNESGEKLLGLCSEQELVVRKAFLENKLINKYT